MVYPFLLAIRGENVRRPLRHLATNQWLSPDALRRYQSARLRDLIEIACRRHPWYARHLAAHGVVPEAIAGLDDLALLPITEKQDIRHLGASLRGERSLARGVTIRKTGGSTGDPCLVYADRFTSANTLAARELCQGWHGLNPGDRQIRFWGRPLESGKRGARLKDVALNRIRLDSLALAPEHLPETLNHIRRFGGEYCYGYASLIRLFADRLTAEQLASCLPRLKAVISTSETLTSRQQYELKHKFGCPVLNEYGCSEVDIIAFECPEGQLHVVAGNLVVEVIRSGDEPDGYGQIVVTDLNNLLLPVVRYRVGDLVPLAMGACSCGRGWPTLGHVLGRSQGQYIVLPGGATVHSQFVVYMIEELVALGCPIARFRIVQDRSDQLTIRVAVAPDGTLDAFGALEYFRREGSRILGDSMTWRLVEEPADVFARDHVNKFSHFESTLGNV